MASKATRFISLDLLTLSSILSPFMLYLFSGGKSTLSHLTSSLSEISAALQSSSVSRCSSLDCSYSLEHLISMLAVCQTVPQRISIKHLSCTILHPGIHSLFSKICLSSYFSCINCLHHSHPGNSDLNLVECVFPFYPYSSCAVSKSE